MIRLSTFTPRMWLILAHDLLATAAAVIASFFIRFEEAGLAQRWRLLVILLPGFLVYAGLVYVFSGLYKAKWRFTSLPDLYNIVRAATVLAVTLLALDYVLLAPNFYGTFFFGKITIVLYWMLQIAFLSGPRITYRYFRYTRTLQRAKEADSDADTGGRAHRRRRCAAARDRKRRGHQNTARGHPVAIVVGSRPSHTRHFRARRSRRHRECRRRSRWSRHQCETARPYAERARARGEAGNNTDAGTAPGVGHQPAACARRRRRGVAACAGQCRGPAAPPAGENRLRASRRISCGTNPSS